jgi:hypothetical protein
VKLSFYDLVVHTNGRRGRFVALCAAVRRRATIANGSSRMENSDGRFCPARIGIGPCHPFLAFLDRIGFSSTVLTAKNLVTYMSEGNEAFASFGWNQSAWLAITGILQRN